MQFCEAFAVSLITSLVRHKVSIQLIVSYLLLHTKDSYCYIWPDDTKIHFIVLLFVLLIQCYRLNKLWLFVGVWQHN